MPIRTLLGPSVAIEATPGEVRAALHGRTTGSHECRDAGCVWDAGGGWPSSSARTPPSRT